MMQGRHHDSRTLYVINVGTKGFKFEGRKSETVEPEG